MNYISMWQSIYIVSSAFFFFLLDPGQLSHFCKMGTIGLAYRDGETELQSNQGSDVR